MFIKSGMWVIDCYGQHFFFGFYMNLGWFHDPLPQHVPHPPTHPPTKSFLNFLLY